MKRFVCFHLCLAFVVVTVAVAGCGWTPLISIGVSVQNADKAFDEAEAFRIQADEDTEQDKRREQVKQKNTLYNDALKAYRAIVKADPTGKYAQRSLWQISEIYKRRYEWDRVTESYEAILAIAPSGYYAHRARNAIADMRKYRLLIQEERRKYQSYRALYAQDKARKYEIAAQALYNLAESHEKLGNYPEAIAHYQRMADEFPDNEKAPAALTKIGYIHYYKLYDYAGGWLAYNKVIETYPNSYDAVQARRLLEETIHNLNEIAQYEAELKRYHCEIPVKFTENHSYDHVDTVIQRLQFIARRWEYLRNYPRAIMAYQKLTNQPSFKKFAAVDARYQIGRLYQLSGKLEHAIEAYQRLFDHYPESIWHAEGVYQQAVCYREIREFTKAYEGFKAYMSLGRDKDYYQEAEEIVRQFETDEDGDGYKFHIEQEAGTSDRDPNDHPSIKS